MTSAYDRAVSDTIRAIEVALDRRGGRRKGAEIAFRCPVHQDEHASAQWNLEKHAWTCFACPSGGGWKNLAELLGVPVPTLQRITLDDLALDKGLSASFLRSVGVDDLPGGGVGIEYSDGTTKRLKRRTALKAKDGSWWPKGQPLMAYGVTRLAAARTAGYLLLVEGESDSWTAWRHDLPCLGIPGAKSAYVLQREHLTDLDRLYVLREPDQGGETFIDGVRDRLKTLGWNGNLFVFTCGDAKDLNALYLRDRDGFRVAVQARLEIATPVEIHSSETTGQADESILRFRTAREIALSVPEAVEWISRPWVARGSLTEVDAKIKLGKSTWVSYLCRAVLDGAPFMGEPTSKGSVVYLTEQPERSFRETLRRAGLLERDDFHVLFVADCRDREWPQVVEAAVAHALAVQAVLLVVDTLPQFAKLRGDSENNSGDALAAVEPLQQCAAHHDLGVVVVRHDRKAGGDPGDSARGSTAFGGSVDIVIQLRRPEGKSTRSSIRVLGALSRFDETPDTLYIDLTDDGYVALGSEAAIAERETRTALLRAAPTSEADALDTSKLMEAADNPKRTVAYEVLEQLIREGLVRRVGAGKRGDPHRYWRADIDSSALKSEVSDETFSAEPQRPRGPLTVQPVLLGHNGQIHSSETPLLTADESIDARSCDECRGVLIGADERQQGIHEACARQLMTSGAA